MVEEAQRLLAPDGAPDAAQPGLSGELRTLALINLGIAEYGAARFEEAEQHLEQGVALARRIGRPYLEFTGIEHQARVEVFWSYARAAERSRQAIELAERHGWTDEAAADIAYMVLAATLIAQGRSEEAERWVQRAERTVRMEAEPAVALLVHYIRGLIELARGRDADALAAFQAAERLGGQLAEPHYLVPATRARLLQALVRLGELEQAEQALAELGEQDRDPGEIRIAVAALRLAQDDPDAATAALAPAVDRSTSVISLSDELASHDSDDSPSRLRASGANHPDCLSCRHASRRSGRRQRSRRAAPGGARVTPRKSPRSAGGRSPGPSRSCKDEEEPAP